MYMRHLILGNRTFEGSLRLKQTELFPKSNLKTFLNIQNCQIATSPSQAMVQAVTKENAQCWSRFVHLSAKAQGGGALDTGPSENQGAVPGISRKVTTWESRWT